MEHIIELDKLSDRHGLCDIRKNILKYVLRNKMDVYEDMLKAQHYIEQWLEVNKGLKT